jgi:hypothetical protein
MMLKLGEMAGQRRRNKDWPSLWLFISSRAGQARTYRCMAGSGDEGSFRASGLKWTNLLNKPQLRCP